MRTILDRARLERASWQGTLRLARWIGSKRLPTCDCKECRTVVITALGKYIEARTWTKTARRQRVRVSSPAEARRLALTG
jgi:hypothetical protein